MKIQAVLFDMGGTIETLAYTREQRLSAIPTIRAFLAQAGIELPLADEPLFEAISAGLSRYKKWSIQSMDELSPARVWGEYALAGMALDMAQLAPVAEDLAALVEKLFYTRAMRPEMPAVLREIRQMGYKIGLISNITSRGLVPANLVDYGIRDYFDPLVLSSEYGRRKPDPAIFHYAARLAGVPASACLYVGDRIHRDIDGARRAGYGMAVQIRHHFAHGENDTGAAPDAVIDSMTELLDILRADQSAPPAPVPPGAVRGLVFDAGDILYYRAVHRVRFQSFLAEHGLVMDPGLEKTRKAIEHRAYRGQISHDEYRAEVVRLYGITRPELIESGKQALVEDDANVVFMPGVPETLRALKQQGYLLAILTDTANTISAKLNWFERGGFGDVWDAIISSMDVGARKPDPRNYQAVLRQLNLTAEQAIFIGHRAAELDGARSVGMGTVAFNFDPDARADCFIDQFADLLNVLGANQPRR